MYQVILFEKRLSLISILYLTQCRHFINVYKTIFIKRWYSSVSQCPIYFVLVFWDTTKVGVHGSKLGDVLVCQKVSSSPIFRLKNGLDDLDVKIFNAKASQERQMSVCPFVCQSVTSNILSLYVN